MNLAELIQQHSKEDFSFEGKFLKQYNKALLTCREEQEYPRTYTRPSSLGKCSRNIYYERTHADKDAKHYGNPWLYNQVGILESGTDRHTRIQFVLKRMEEMGFIKNIDIPEAIELANSKGINTRFHSWNEEKTEARCVNDDLGIYFQPDGLVEMDGITAIFEIKTTSCKKIAELRKTKTPFYTHIRQATAYAMGLGVDYVLFFYEDRDFTQHVPILYKIDELDRYYIKTKLEHIDHHVECNTVPPAEKSTDNCKFCEYKELCAVQRMKDDF